MKIIINKHHLDLNEEEVVERKGLGHPDTLADALAEHLSREYSKYTLKRFGVILHHNFDKLELLGGESKVKFGKGYLTKPIRIILNGRASQEFAEEEIPVKEILEKSVLSFFKTRFPEILNENLSINYFLSTASSPGHSAEKVSALSARNYWFKPRGVRDLPEYKFLNSNDTSMGCGYFPYSTLEKTILEIENLLNSISFKNKNKWIGSDIKLMGIKTEQTVSLTLCIPQIANHVKSLEDYISNLNFARKIIEKIIIKNFGNQKYDLDINTRDNYKSKELYLTAIGSSIESGDEGVVGRGNRVNGLISSCKPMSMEGACGKNPVYHVGKLYNIAAFKIARALFSKTKKYSEVYLVSQSGRKLTDPWKILVKTSVINEKDLKLIKNIVEEEIIKIPLITDQLIKGQIELY